MQREDIHELAAGYALDALDPAERDAFDAHLAECWRCREELASLQEAAAALAAGVEAPAPPSALRGRVLDQVRGERSNVVPLRARRPRLQLLPAVAAVAACAP